MYIVYVYVCKEQYTDTYRENTNHAPHMFIQPTNKRFYWIIPEPDLYKDQLNYSRLNYAHIGESIYLYE